MTQDQATHKILASEYFLLFKLADAMDSVLRAAGMDFCGGGCGGTCPLCVARARFAPTRPCVVLRTDALEC